MSQLEAGLNGVARKVFDAVPAQEVWSKEQICGEIRRGGSNVGRDIVDSCLHTLRGRGLIKEPERGKFVRVQPRPGYEPPEEIECEASAGKAKEECEMNKKTETPDALGRLAGVAKLMRQAADDIEAAALDFEERAQAQDRDTEKLRQLQALLKSLGT